MGRDYITRDELEQQLEQFGEALLRSFIKVMAPGGRNDPAFIAAAARAAEMEEHDPTFAGQVAAVAKARRDGAHISLGVDAGHRSGPGLVKLGGAGDAEPSDDTTMGPAQRAIRRRLRRGRED